MLRNKKLSPPRSAKQPPMVEGQAQSSTSSAADVSGEVKRNETRSTGKDESLRRRMVWDTEQEKYVRRLAVMGETFDLSSKKKEEMRTIRALNLDHNCKHPIYHGGDERDVSKMRQRLNRLQADECQRKGDDWKTRMANIDLKNKVRWAKEKSETFWSDKIQETTQKIKEADKKLEEADATIDSEIVQLEQLSERIKRSKRKCSN